MSLFGKVLGGAVKLVPGLAQVFPKSSLLKKAAGTLANVGGILAGPLGGMPGVPPTFSGVPSFGGSAASLLPALPKISGGAVATVGAAAGALVPIGRGLVRRYGKKAMQALNLFAIGSIVYDAATGQAVGTRYTRKINPLNHKELRFALRRVKASGRVAHTIEKVLGKGAVQRLGRRC